MKTLVPSLLLLFSMAFGYAQDGIVTIKQDEKITQLLDIYKSANSNEGFYTIQIVFGSYSYASLMKTEVGIDFPQYSSKIIFDSPTYRVHLGRFKSKLEVERIFNEVRKKYTESIILKPESENR
jgi:hypothetical protein